MSAKLESPEFLQTSFLCLNCWMRSDVLGRKSTDASQQTQRYLENSQDPQQAYFDAQKLTEICQDCDAKRPNIVYHLAQQKDLISQ